MRCEVCSGYAAKCPACDVLPGCAGCGVELTDLVCNLGLDDETPALCWSCDPAYIRCTECGEYALVVDGTLASCGHGGAQ